MTLDIKEPPYQSIVRDKTSALENGVLWAWQRTANFSDGYPSWQLMATSDEWYTWEQILRTGEVVVVFDSSVGGAQ